MRNKTEKLILFLLVIHKKKVIQFQKEKDESDVYQQLGCCF